MSKSSKFAFKSKPQPRMVSSIADDEVSRFSSQADDWWKVDGVFAPLHRLNPLRLAYIREQAVAALGITRAGRTPFLGLTVLDVGCGGGVLAEPLCRLGGHVTGIDASNEGIAAARAHSSKMQLDIAYKVGSIEDLAASGAQFDVVTCMEVAEHVAELDVFTRALMTVVKPGGVLLMSTLNRTPKSFLLGIVAAEYILHWVPRGTHKWKKFIRPSELVARLEKVGMIAVDITGIAYNPLHSEFEITKKDIAVNYMLTAVKPLD